jgi:hypothetical protein
MGQFDQSGVWTMTEILEALFSSTARVKVLRLFLLNPGSSFYQREIERETDQPIRAVQREVARLAKMELLSRSKDGNRVFYSLDAGFPLLAELTALFQKASDGEIAEEATGGESPTPPEPSTIQQPFPWMETPIVATLPEALRRRQVGGEWDQGY